MSDVNSDVVDHWPSHRSAYASKIKNFLMKCNLLVKSTNFFICMGFTHSNISHFSYQIDRDLVGFFFQ